MIVFEQPKNIVNVSDYALVNTGNKKGEFGIILWGENSILKPTNDIFKNYLIGFKGKTQLSTRSSWWPGSTGIQADGDTIGINLESWSIWNNMKSNLNKGTIVMAYNFPVIAVKNKTFIYSFDMAVPSMKTFNRGVAQVTAWYRVADKKNKKSFWLGINLADSRESIRYHSHTMLDVGTNTYMVSCGIDKSIYDFGNFNSSNFSDFRHYEFKVNNDRILDAVSKLNAKGLNFSDNIDDYVIYHINLNPELRVWSWFDYAQIGIKVKNWKLQYN